MIATSATDLCFTDAASLLDAYHAGTLSPVEVTQTVLDRIERLNGKLHAFLLVDREGAMRSAQAAEAAYLAGNAGPLAGVPISIKDLLEVRGLPTTFGSLAYRDRVATQDSPSVARLRAAGAVFLGKTNTPEFGSLPTNENRLGPAAANPWDTTRTPGGSSGGAGAAVAAGLGPIALGTDFGGSIRIPAAMCGVVGFKPTLGRIARDCAFNLTGEFFSHEGPLSRTVRDAALLMDVCAGPDTRDRFSQLGEPPAFARDLEALPERLQVAWPVVFDEAAVDREYLEICERAVRRFESVVGEISRDVPSGIEPGIAAWLVAGRAGNFNAERYLVQKAHPDDLTGAVRADVAALEKTRLKEYLDAVVQLRVWRSEVAAFFGRYDLLLMPAVPVPAIPIGARGLEINGHSTPNVFGLIGFTAPFNATGGPVVSMPCGFTAAGLPVGIQIAGPFGADQLVLQAARAFEQALPEALQRPPLP